MEPDCLPGAPLPPDAGRIKRDITTLLGFTTAGFSGKKIRRLGVPSLHKGQSVRYSMWKNISVEHNDYSNDDPKRH